jgi:hypothetical protein
MIENKARLKITIPVDAKVSEFFDNLDMLKARIITYKAIGPAGGNPEVIVEFPRYNYDRAKMIFQVGKQGE